MSNITDGMPDSIKEAAERIKQAELAMEQSNATASNVIINKEQEPLVTDELPTPVPVVTVTPPAVEDDTRKQIAELKLELSRRSGEYGSELDKLRKSLQVATQNNAYLNDELARLSKTVKSADEPAKEESWDAIKAKYFKGVPEETLSSYRNEVFDAMAKIAHNAAKDSASKMPDNVRQVVEDIPKINSKLASNDQANFYNSFLDQVEFYAPGFKSFNGNMIYNIPAKQEWTEFLAQPILPNSNSISWNSYIQSNPSPQVAADAFKLFMQNQQAKQAPKQPDMVPVQAQINPQKSGTRPAVSDGKKTYRMDDYKRLLDEARSGKYPYSKIEPMIEEYQQAGLEGRLI